MTTTETVDAADVICGLKGAVTALERYYDLELRKEALEAQRERTGVCSTKPYRNDVKGEYRPVVAVKPFREWKAGEEFRRRGPCPKKQPNAVDKCTRQKHRKYEEIHKNVLYPEMRGGVLYTRCNCVHRDGLQGDCPLTQCQGQPECLVKPWPVCPPGCFLRCMYPELYPPEPEADNSRVKRICTD